MQGCTIQFLILEVIQINAGGLTKQQNMIAKTIWT